MPLVRMNKSVKITDIPSYVVVVHSVGMGFTNLSYHHFKEDADEISRKVGGLTFEIQHYDKHMLPKFTPEDIEKIKQHFAVTQ